VNAWFSILGRFSGSVLAHLVTTELIIAARRQNNGNMYCVYIRKIITVDNWVMNIDEFSFVYSANYLDFHIL
jgi:hypothetical protein